MNVLQQLGLAMIATIFVHFRNDATGNLAYLKDPITGEDDKSKPIGVNIFGPGSKEYKAAQSAITQEAIDEKRRKITAAQIENGAVELMARTTTDFVNWSYTGPADGPALPETATMLERARAFYLDPHYVNLRRQVEDKQGDVGNFLASASSR